MRRRSTGKDVFPRCSFLSSHGIEMETVGFLPLLSVVRFLLLPVEDSNNDEDEDAHSDQCDGRQQHAVARSQVQLSAPTAGLIVGEGDDNELGVGNDGCPLLLPYFRLSRLPGDADEKVVQEVGAASEAQHSVGQLEGEVSRLAQLTS